VSYTPACFIYPFGTAPNLSTKKAPSIRDFPIGHPRAATRGVKYHREGDIANIFYSEGAKSAKKKEMSLRVLCFSLRSSRLGGKEKSRVPFLERGRTGR
jgi:hypothetical protein